MMKSIGSGIKDYLRSRIRFDRHEFSGSFGDIGTDFPLIVGMILASGLDVPSVFVMFGAMQILTGFLYGIPMAVQPLKVIAVIVISQKIAPSVIYGAGFSIGVVMFLLTITGCLNRLARLVPRSVIRGVQFGLGLTLATTAFKNYIVSDGPAGCFLAIAALVTILLLMRRKRWPIGPIVILLGIIYALVCKIAWHDLGMGVGLRFPHSQMPLARDIWAGFLLLALPQLPLSICNSVFATQQTIRDLFPEKAVSIRKIGLTYSLMNLVNPFLSGIPTCHGTGGLAGHYAFGGRTGGSVIIYGLFYVVIGLFFGQGFSQIVMLFPQPLLGVILVFESLALMQLLRDMESREDISIALLVGLACMGLPNGFVIGMVGGTLLAKVQDLGWIRLFRD